MKSKVSRIIAEYDLLGMGERLVEYWTRKDNRAYSLRDLADYFNCEILRSAMKSASMTTLDGEVENTYRLLTADDVSTGIRTQAEATLKHNSINVEKLTDDFVSHQSIHTYLTKYRGVERPSESTEDRVQKTNDTIQRLSSRLIAVAEKRLYSLRNSDAIDLGTFSVLVDISVVCEDCGTHYDVRTLLEEGGCGCVLSS